MVELRGPLPIGRHAAQDGAGPLLAELSRIAVLEGVCAWLAVLNGLVAAVLWLRASRVHVPPFPGVGLDSGPEVFEPVRRALAKGADLNARAAAVTAAAVVLQALALGLHQVGR